MPIRITKVAGGYVADVTPPHGRGVAWSTDAPQSMDCLIDALRRLGCHQTDIGDALHEADPAWDGDERR